MPYVITTNSPHSSGVVGHTIETARRAVATLDEPKGGTGARKTVVRIIGRVMDRFDPNWDYSADAENEFVAQAMALPESGGTVGPLPDGTVIEVQSVSMNWIVGVAEDRGAEIGEDASDAECIDAFNAREGSE